MIAEFMRSALIRRGFLDGVYPLYAAMYSTPPNDLGYPGVELLINRVEVTPAMLTESAPGEVSNTAPIVFQAIFSSPTIRGIGILDAPTGGNLLAFTSVTPYTPQEGAQVEWPPGTLIIRLD